MTGRLECWTTLDGKTVCMNCASLFTASRPVALLPPRTCSECKKEITDPWPQATPQTTVVNLRTSEFDVYIGRAGRGWSGYFGNPFRRKPGEPPGATIERYRTYFLERVEKDPEFRERVMALEGKRLGCFCAPNPCHGDVIVWWLNTPRSPWRRHCGEEGS